VGRLGGADTRPALLRSSEAATYLGIGETKLRELVDALERTYCSSIGSEESTFGAFTICSSEVCNWAKAG
jgi:2-oxoglutarate dehydrogenase complex dehydrogenase (E1) component-like enzyme